MTQRLQQLSGLPPYPGGKRRLLAWIFANLTPHVPISEWSDLTFMDAFLGGGAVSLYAKAQGFKQILANDYSARSQVVGEALLINQNRRLLRPDILEITEQEPTGWIQERFTPDVFSSRHAEMLDRVFQASVTAQNPTLQALYRLLLWHLAGAFVSFGSSIGTSNRPYAEALEGLRSWDEIPPKRFFDQSVCGLLVPTWTVLERRVKHINKSVFGGSPVSLFRQDACEFVTQNQGDIVYFDPPYAQTSRYESGFKVIDALLAGCEATEPSSAFSRDVDVLDGLFESARHIPIWVLSYGDKTIDLEALKARVQAHRPNDRISAHARQYTHMAHVSRNRTHQELLIVVSPKDRRA